MRSEPPANLVQLLRRLGLANSQQVAAVAPRAARLAGDLPDFESVWVDALAQVRLLSSFQAERINAGRGASLAVGPYCLIERLPDPHFAECFLARHLESQRRVRLYVARGTQRSLAETSQAVAALAARGRDVPRSHAGAISDCGATSDTVWAACDETQGTSAQRWIVEKGRMQPTAVLRVAVEMAGQLAALEDERMVHGDVSLAGLLLGPSGIALPAPGLRPAVRPHEGYSFADLPAEAYDYLAPERIGAGRPASVATDLYACAAVWWHLLAGRAPYGGGNSLARLKAVHAARLVDIRQLAPEVSPVLYGVMTRMLARDAESRPRSFSEVAEQLASARRDAWRQGVLQAQAEIVVPALKRRTASRASVGFAVGASLAATVLCLVFLPALWRMSRPGAAAPGFAAVETALPRPAPAKIHRDNQVKPATATQPARPPAPEANELVLPTDRPLEIEQLDLRAGIRVRGRSGKRPRLSVPARGLTIAHEGVCFDGVDFVWQHDESGRAAQLPAMLVCRATSLELRGCSLTAATGELPAAIAWVGAAEELPGLGGEMRLVNCTFGNVAAVVDARGRGSLQVSLENTLCVDSGPMLRLGRVPAAGESMDVRLQRVTARGDTQVVQCRYARVPNERGSITIAADDSVFAGNRGPLIELVSSVDPRSWLASIQWQGQGSIVAESTPMCVWSKPGGGERPVDDAALEVGGLVRSNLQFAGEAHGPPSASRVVRWQVPLRSADPPGADPAQLHSPRNGPVEKPRR